MDKQLQAMAESHPVCKRLMSVPGVGPVTALAFLPRLKIPTRFTNPADVSAYLGLTPRTHQSGNMNVRALPSEADA